MVRNVEGLKRSARSRSAETMERATAAMRLMHSEEMEINFRSVAARAQVSTAWLYGTKALRAAIMKDVILRRLPPARICNIGNGSRMNGSWQLSDSAFARWRKSIAN
jgi:hypothetical protein